MVLTTEDEHRVAGFYDWLAPEYDRMTGFEKRFIHEKPFFRMLVERFGIRTALDAGAGTGFHSLLLSQLGVDVTAMDVSPAMLRMLQANARQRGLHVRVVEGSFEDVPLRLADTLDAVFCLGNSLAHVLPLENLRRSLENFASVLKPDGMLFLQTVNFDRLSRSGDRIQSIKEIGDVMTVRFYDSGEEFVRFNVLRIEKIGGELKHDMNSILLRPVMKGDITNLLAESGFADIKTYGGITLEEFDPGASRDLVILARKN